MITSIVSIINIHGNFKMALLLVLLCMSLVIVKGEGSHCMATTSGAQHGLSLYLRVCCVNSNLGQTVHNSNKYNLHVSFCQTTLLST